MTQTPTLDLAALGFRAGDLGSLVRVVEAKDLLDHAVSCGNRRASVCGCCSTLYKYDAYNVIAG